MDSARIFVVALLVVGSGIARAEKLSFAEGRNYFSAEKTATKFIFKDEMGYRTLKIEPCNKEIIESFWHDLSASIKDNKERRKPAFNFHPPSVSQQFLEKAREFSHAVFFRSRQQCG